MAITNPQGLHARPASLFVQLASRFKSQVTVKKDDEGVDGKSIMGLLMLALERGSTVELIAEGPDAAEAIEALSQFLTQDKEPGGPVWKRGGGAATRG